MRLIAFVCSIIILVMISMGATCRPRTEGFSNDTVLDWIRDGILNLRVVPDMIYGGSVDVGTVPVEESVVWRTMFAKGTDGLLIYASDTPNRLQLKLNSRHPNAVYFTHYDKKLEGLGLTGTFPLFTKLSGHILSYNSRTALVKFDSSFVGNRGNSIDDLYKCLLYVSLVKFCDENPLLIEEVVAVEEKFRSTLLSTKAMRQSEAKKMTTMNENTRRLLKSRLDKRIEGAEDAVLKKQLESDRVRRDMQNQTRVNDTNKVSLEARLRELTNLRSKNVRLMKAKNNVDVDKRALLTMLNDVDLAGARRTATRDRNAMMGRQRSLDTEIDAVRKSLREQTIKNRDMLNKHRSLEFETRNLTTNIRKVKDVVADNVTQTRKIHTEAAQDAKSLQMLDSMYVNASEDVQNLTKAINKNTNETLKLEGVVLQKQPALDAKTIQDTESRRALVDVNMTTESAQNEHDELERKLRDLKVLQDNSSRYAEETQVNVQLKERWQALHDMLKARANAVESTQKAAADKLASEKAAAAARLAAAIAHEKKVAAAKLKATQDYERGIAAELQRRLNSATAAKSWTYYDQQDTQGVELESERLSKNAKESRNWQACRDRAKKRRGVNGWTYSHNSKNCTLYTKVHSRISKGKHHSGELK